MHKRLIGFLGNTFRDRFKRYLITSLIIVGVVLAVTGNGSPAPIDGEGFEVHFFYVTGCPGCDAQKPFNTQLAARYPMIAIIEHNAIDEAPLLRQMLDDRGIDESPPVPVTIFDNQVFMGWVSEETTGAEIEDALRQCLDGECPPPTGRDPEEGIDIPIFGRIIFADYSLAALAVILGIVDGFNPCALWVLLYLISLVATLRDKKRIWLIVGSFVLASGVIYFLLMTAWLNVFLLIGFVRPVMVVIGLVALGGGILQIKESIQSKGEIVCEVTSQESQQKTMAKMQRIVSRPVTIATILGIIALAFTVNSIEFVCSAAIPAVFTQVLALSNLTTVQYYGYILLYVFFFILDNLIIFGGAAFAMTSSMGVKYAKYARPIGAVILILLGVLLLFFPGWLR
ncbi:MAG: hypothetical protein IBX67_00650 [Dehalococcoidia bacterium]|nr:hypothetical protein [Dehalococcoidia bacterium]